MACRIEKTRAFDAWLEGLKDRAARQRIVVAIDRMRFHGGVVGDVKSVGAGVLELRINAGPGYRVYFSVQGGCVILLLAGGDKSTQRRDVKKAQALLREWRGDHAC